MAAISNIQGATEPRVMSPVKDSTRPEPADDRKSRSDGASELPGQDRGAVKVPGGDSALAEDQVRELAEHIQEVIDKATNQAHSVGFRFDERIEDFVIEIHDEQGDLVKQYPPEIVLNLHRKMAELSGMVVDERT